MTDTLPVVAVIGCPIAHSKSPKMHGYWLKQNNIAGHYVPLHVEPDAFADVLKTLPKMGFVGANVTIPHKEAALALADYVTDRAAKIGAANTLVFDENGKIHADNTDGYGFLENILVNAPNWDLQSGPAMILGAGGAARAIIVALLDHGVPELRITNRTKSRAEQLAQEFGPKVTVIDWDTADQHLSDVATLVNTTSLGMSGHGELSISLGNLAKTALVTDIVYTPLMTPLLQRAADHGCVTVDGLGMLIYQGIPGFERWFGAKPQVTQELRDMLLS